MTIVYDISHINKQRTGIGRLATIQLKGLLSLDRRRRYILHGWGRDLDMDTIRAFARENVEISTALLPKAVKRLYWNYLRFPALDTVVGSFDLFHSAEPLLPPIGKRKAIVSFNDSAYYKFPHFYNKTTARKWDYLYRRALRRADAIIVLSENTRNDLIEMLNLRREQIYVVRPPTDPIFSPERSPEAEEQVRRKYSLPDQFFLFVGTLEPRKNIPRLVRAFEKFLLEHQQPMSLVIVGRRGWLYEDILHTVNTSPARDRILLLDYVADDDLAVLYRLALVFVFPSLYEGHGYPVVEAMASGTPVITSRNSSLKEIAEGAALLVDAENVDEICEAMYTLATDENLRRELVAKGLRRAEQFSVKNAAEGILAVYDSLEVR